MEVSKVQKEEIFEMQSMPHQNQTQIVKEERLVSKKTHLTLSGFCLTLVLSHFQSPDLFRGRDASGEAGKHFLDNNQSIKNDTKYPPPFDDVTDSGKENSSEQFNVSC